MTAPAAALADTVVVVSGLPRSGTSLLMAMLQAGGVPLLTDGQRAPDTDNPRGYFEFEAVKALRTDAAWLAEARGKAVKIVAPLVFQLPPALACRILFLERDLDEVVASQTAMLARKGITSPLSPSALKAALARQVAQARVVLTDTAQRRVCFVEHRRLIQSPHAAARSIADFLGGGLNVAAMAAVVEPGLYRQRHTQAALPFS